MMGLVYSHEPMGALPIGHYKIVGLPNIKVQEEEGYDTTVFHFYPNTIIDKDYLSEDDKKILDRVIKKFGTFSAKRIVEYMHKEKAYAETNDKEVISYRLSKGIREF